MTEFNGLGVILKLGQCGSVPGARHCRVVSGRTWPAWPDTANDVTPLYLGSHGSKYMPIRPCCCSCVSGLQFLTSTALNLICTSAVHPLPHAVPLSLFTRPAHHHRRIAKLKQKEKNVQRVHPMKPPLSPSPSQPTNKCEQRYLATSCHLHCSTQFDEHYTHTLTLYLTCTRKQTHSLLPFPLCLLLTLSPPQPEFQRQRLSNTPAAWTTTLRQKPDLSRDTPPVTIPRYGVWFHPSALVPWPCRLDGFRHCPGKQSQRTTRKDIH